MKDPVKIDKKIKGYAVLKKDDDNNQEKVESGKIDNAAIDGAEVKNPEFEPTVMGEHIERPLTLLGTTYKIEKSPATGHAMYITINDIVLDQGTDHEHRRPFEIFINSKNMEQFQWVVAMTRILSAVFRKGGDVSFLAEEMKSVFDPKGGYFKGGSYMPSLIAEIGQVIEAHLESLGLLGENKISPSAKKLVEEKQKAESFFSQSNEGDEKSNVTNINVTNINNARKTESKEGKSDLLSSDKEIGNNGGEGSFPPNATMCNKCFQKSMIIMDGCETCLNCGNSKCG